MICNIRRLSTWEHLASLTALDWELPLWAEDDEQGRVTIFGEQPDYSGQWACINGGLFFISGSAPDSGSTKLTLRLPRYAFSRELPYSGTGSETYGEFIAGIITAEYIGQADTEYATPYLSVSNTDKTAFTFPVESGKLYALSDIWTAAEKAGVRFVFSTTPDALTLTVETGEQKTVNLFSGNAGVIVSSQQWSSSVVAKVTVRPEAGTPEDWYLQEDGSVAQTPPQERLHGQWTTVEISGDKPPQEAAQEAMDNNTAGYKIELHTTRTDLHLGDTAMLRTGGLTRSIKLSACIASSADSRRKIKCGTLAATLSDALRQATQGRK